MKYIFPLNYNKPEKFLGIFDTKTVIVIIAWGIVLFYFLRGVNLSLIIDIYFFLILFLFPSIIVLIGVNGENMLQFMRYIAKFFTRKRVYVYRKF